MAVAGKRLGVGAADSLLHLPLYLRRAAFPNRVHPDRLRFPRSSNLLANSPNCPSGCTPLLVTQTLLPACLATGSKVNMRPSCSAGRPRGRRESERRQQTARLGVVAWWRIRARRLIGSDGRSTNPILEAWPESRFLAAPYVLEGIEREYDEKVKFWPSIYGDLVPKNPRKPESYPYSFFILPGNSNSPIFTVGPCQGDSVNHSMFYLPREKVIITGDCMYSRSVHVWAAEIDTPEILSGWQNILDLIEGLDVDLIVPGHAETEDFLNKAADLEYNRKYLELFATKITYAEKKPQVKEIVETFKSAFPDCKHNHGFFLGKLGDCYGEGGPGWEENAHHACNKYTTGDLEGYVMAPGAAALEKRMRA